MKLTPVLIPLSLAANVALVGWVLRGRAESIQTSRSEAPTATYSAAAPIARSDAGAPSKPAASTPVALRDRLQALGFSPDEVRAAVRAHIEAPRLARQREIFSEAARAPWWQSETSSFALLNAGVAGFNPQQTAELRQLLRAEREELVRLFGPGADIMPLERERFAFLPDDKATRVASIDRDYLELNRELTSGRGAVDRAALEQQRELLKASRERDLLAVLTPEERDELELRTSTSAYSVARDAKYFAADESLYRALFESVRKEAAAREFAERERLTNPNARAAIEISERADAERRELLGAERYAEWQRSQREENRALVELQRRFSLDAGTASAVAAVPQQIVAEALRLTEQSRDRDANLNALRDLANEGRARIRTILGPDLGDAYNEASARGWLDYLERGMIPMYQPNGRFVVRMVGSTPGLPIRRNPPPAVAPQR